MAPIGFILHFVHCEGAAIHSTPQWPSDAYLDTTITDSLPFVDAALDGSLDGFSDSMTDVLTDSPLDGSPSSISQVAVGATHVCVLKQGKVYCWGDNRYGQAGQKPAPPSDSGTQSNAIRPSFQAPIDISETVVEIGSGRDFSCARTLTDFVFCWGRNQYGQLGSETLIDDHSYKPVRLSLSQYRSKQLALSVDHACMIAAPSFSQTEHDVRCWGRNEAQHRVSKYTDAGFVRVPSSPGDNLSALKEATIRVGENFSCVNHSVSDEAVIRCWGEGSSGQLAQDHLSIPQTGLLRVVDPAPATPQLKGYKALQLGWYFGCALDSDSKLKCWGQNEMGQLGNTGYGTTHVPQNVIFESPTSPQLFALGTNHACISTSDGNLYCCGKFQIVPETGPSPKPVLVGTFPAGIQSLSANEGNTCFVSNNTVVCWGDNTYRQLGRDTSLTHSSSPSAVKFE